MSWKLLGSEKCARYETTLKVLALPGVSALVGTNGGHDNIRCKRGPLLLGAFTAVKCCERRDCASVSR